MFCFSCQKMQQFKATMTQKPLFLTILRITIQWLRSTLETNLLKSTYNNTLQSGKLAKNK